MSNTNPRNAGRKPSIVKKVRKVIAESLALEAEVKTKLVEVASKIVNPVTVSLFIIPKVKESDKFLIGFCDDGIFHYEIRHKDEPCCLLGGGSIDMQPPSLSQSLDSGADLSHLEIWGAGNEFVIQMPLISQPLLDNLGNDFDFGEFYHDCPMQKLINYVNQVLGTRVTKENSHLMMLEGDEFVIRDFLSQN